MEIEMKKQFSTVDYNRIQELENWRACEYPRRLNTINQYKYWGFAPPETRYELEKEAYEKEQELRKLKGLKPLPELKISKIL